MGTSVKSKSKTNFSPHRDNSRIAATLVGASATAAATLLICEILEWLKGPRTGNLFTQNPSGRVGENVCSAS